MFKLALLHIAALAITFLQPAGFYGQDTTGRTMHVLRDSTFYGDTATIQINRNIVQEITPEQRYMAIMMLRYGIDFFKDDIFLPQNAMQDMLRDQQIPNRNNIDQLVQSINYNLHKDYDKYRKAAMLGSILNYLSFLLLFL